MRTGQNGDAEGLIIGLVSPKTKASTDPVPARPVQSRRGSRPNARRPGHSTARAFMSTPRPSATLDRPHTPSTGPLSLPVFFGAPLVAACAKIRAAPVWQRTTARAAATPHLWRPPSGVVGPSSSRPGQAYVFSSTTGPAHHWRCCLRCWWRGLCMIASESRAGGSTGAAT